MPALDLGTLSFEAQPAGERSFEALVAGDAPEVGLDTPEPSSNASRRWPRTTSARTACRTHRRARSGPRAAQTDTVTGNVASQIVVPTNRT